MRSGPDKSPARSWPRLEQLAAPPHEALAGFVHGCAEKSADRTAAVTTQVMTVRQLAGKKMSHRLPSLVLVNFNGEATDPNDLLASQLLAAPDGSGPRIYHEGSLIGRSPKQAPAAMINAIRAKQKLGAITPANTGIHADLEHRYFDVQRTGFGCGPTRAYASAFLDAFGLLTDRKGELILRLDGQDDCDTFRRDVLKEPDKIRASVGYGPELDLVSKSTALSGSIPTAMWDAELARGTVELGLPILMLPGLAKDTPVTENLPVLELLASTLPKSFDAPVVEPANVIPEP